MGFSTIGASVIIFAGFLFVASTTANAYFEAHRDYTEALEEDRQREAFHRATAITLTSGGHDGAGIFYLNVTNSGDTVIDISHLALLVDGSWATDSITGKTIDGRITGLWAPGELLRIETNTANEPARAYLVIETGHGILWTP